MIKILSALTVSTFIASALFILPSFAPPVEAKPALAKGDRLVSGVIGTNCAKQTWPNYSASCLRGGAGIREARLIHARG